MKHDPCQLIYLVRFHSRLQWRRLIARTGAIGSTVTFRTNMFLVTPASGSVVKNA
jgi:hypothetical protein